jgi:Carboxypeptidase regulatory-like domain
MRRRKRALVVAMAALVMGAACSSGNSGTFKQVQGRVVDRRTGKPVAQARLEATTPQTATVSGSTDAQGRFTLGKVSKQAMLKVTATNYQPANLQLSEGLLEVQLTPVLVSGKVTSGLTQAGLQATLRGKTSEQTKTRPDGSFEISGVGPGDTLSVRALLGTRRSR